MDCLAKRLTRSPPRPTTGRRTDRLLARDRVYARPFTYWFRRLRIPLPVDAATARRIVLADRCNLIALILALSYLVFAVATLS
jgi:hypothetical protein